MTKLMENISKIKKTQKMILWCLVFMIIFSGAFYLYFMTATIINTSAMNKNLIEIKIVERDYQQIEEIYIDKISKLTLSHALSIGFEEKVDGKFVSRGGVFAKR